MLRRSFHLYWRFARGLTVGVRGLVIDGAGRVFLVKHSYIAGWHLPGGGVEVGETLAKALERELREEGNIELTGPAASLCHLLTIGVCRGAITSRSMWFVFSVRMRPPQPNHEIAAHGFFPPDALPADTTRATRARIAEVLEPISGCRGLVNFGTPRYHDLVIQAASFGHLSRLPGTTTSACKLFSGLSAAIEVAEGETLMRKKILALAAAVALGTATMSTGAFAMGHGGGGGGHVGGGAHFGGAHVGGGAHFGGAHFAGGPFRRSSCRRRSLGRRLARRRLARRLGSWLWVPPRLGWGPGIGLGLGLGGLYAYDGYPGYCGYPYYDCGPYYPW